MNIENKLEAFRMDDGLKNLTKKLNEFNPFRILRIESFEIRHSNMLAWLLNPKGNHELGNAFLKSFLYKTINNKENKPKVDALEGGARIIKNIGSLDDYSDLDYSDLDYSDLIIEREKYQIDILATSTKGTFVLLIENKIYSDERTNQLETYYKKVKEAYRKHIVLPIYLTLFSEPPSHNSYFVASYLDIVEILDDEIKKNKNKSDKPSYQFINDYNKILKELLNMDKEIDDLCRGIFAEHRDAIDRIYSIGYKIDFTFPIEELRKIDNIKIIEKKKDVFRFSIPDFQMNPIMRPFWGETHHEYPFAFFCWVGRDKPDSKEYIIKLCLEMEGLNQRSCPEMFAI